MKISKGKMYSEYLRDEVEKGNMSLQFMYAIMIEKYEYESTRPSGIKSAHKN